MNQNQNNQNYMNAAQNANAVGFFPNNCGIDLLSFLLIINFDLLK